MRLSDYLAEYEEERPLQDRTAELSNELRERVRDDLYALVPSERIAQLVAGGRERARNELAAYVDQVINAGQFGDLSQSARSQLVEETLDMVLGLGPLEGLLADPGVSEIMVNGPSSVFYEVDGKIRASGETFVSEEQLRLVVDRIVSPLGRRVDEQSPIVNARLPEGHRVNVVIPPLSLGGTTVTIRKFRERAFSLSELVELGTLSPEISRLLCWAVRARCNIAVSGGTGGGKTTLLNALSQQIPCNERIVTIEDSAELRFDTHPHVVRLEARMANAEGRGEVTIRDLVVNALRMRPDRIVVGECRGAEAADMLQAMTTGHDGSLTTLHANSPAEVVSRLVMMVRYGLDLPTRVIEAQIASALDIVVQQDRMGDGSRRITQVVMRGKGHHRISFFDEVVTWNRREGTYQWKDVPQWVDDLSFLGIATGEEVETWRRSVHCC